MSSETDLAEAPAPETEAAPAPTPAAPKNAPTGILWLASYPKSGNTWTRTFLHNLLKILENAEDEAQDINGMNEFTTWEISARAYELELGKPPKDCDRAEIAAIRPKIQQQIAERTEGLALIKTHHALVMDRGVPTINFAVSSGAVYIVRNPLDVAISFSHHMSSTIDHAIEEMAMVGLETAVTDKSVYEVYGSWSQHVESWTRRPHRTVYIQRYEDLTDNPFRTFGALARHLLLRPTAEQLGKAIERSSFENLQKQEAKEGFREKPEKAEKFFRQGKAGVWREQLSRRQIRRIVQDHHVQMRRFGYLTEDLMHLVPN